MVIEIRQTTACASQALIRTHKVVIDRPTEKGGTDAGPMGGELFLASVGGCFLSNLLAAIGAREAAVTNVRVAVIAQMEGAPPRFSALALEATAECGDADLFAKLVEIADRACIMMNTLRGKLDVTVRGQTRPAGR
jgi:putative redox protein